MGNLTFADNFIPILNLFLSLAEHFGIISALAFVLLSTRTLQRMISRELTMQDKLALILFFGAFGIFGTYDGDPISGVIANLRAISMILAGLIGGPVVGIGAGLIAGGHRFLIDMHGFSAVPCALGTFIEGSVAGLVSMRLKNKALSWRVALPLGLLGETVHMGLVLLLSHPLDNALAVVRLIGLPMIVLNGIGAGCLIEIIRMVVRNRERRASIQARKAMTIANQTVVHLREGLHEASALATARIIHQQAQVAAVAITDTRQLLAYVGIGMPEKAISRVFAKEEHEPSNTGIGLYNVNQRLVQIYGPAAGLQIKSSDEMGTSVSVNLPLIKNFANWDVPIQKWTGSNCCPRQFVRNQGARKI